MKVCLFHITFNNSVLQVYISYILITLDVLLLLICKSACESTGLEINLKPEWKTSVWMYLGLQYLQVIPITQKKMLSMETISVNYQLI